MDKINLESRKKALVQESLKIDNEKLITAFQKIYFAKQTEFFEENLTPMSLENFNKEIYKAVNAEENNRLIRAQDLKEKIQKCS